MTVEKWERRSEVPLILLAGAFLVAYAWPVLDPRLDPSTRTVLDALSWTVWGAFAVDLLIRLVLTDNRRSYLLRHWYDVALVALPLLRPLRLLRLLALMRILDRSAANNLAGRVLVYITAAASCAVGLGALAVLDAERGAPTANITTIGDAAPTRPMPSTMSRTPTTRPSVVTGYRSPYLFCPRGAAAGTGSSG